MPNLEYVVKGFKHSVTFATSRTRLPITPDLLCRMRMVWQGWKNRRDASMVWAAMTMCFCGFLRSGEVVAPSQSTFDPSRHLCYMCMVMYGLTVLTPRRWCKFISRPQRPTPSERVCQCTWGLRVESCAQSLPSWITRSVAARTRVHSSHLPMDPSSLVTIKCRW